MSPIPSAARATVKARDGGRCVRCGLSGRELHHRMRRRDAGHPVSVLVTLCWQCHRWAHAYPLKAKEAGFILSPWLDDTVSAPIKAFYGWVRFDNEGGIEYINDPSDIV